MKRKNNRCYQPGGANKVLLYEPGTEGHRPVILKYLSDHLPRLGWDVLVDTSPAHSRLDSDAIRELATKARQAGCSVLHLLTIDGCVRRWLIPRNLERGNAKRIPIVGTYYLFNNLRGLAGFPWLVANALGYMDRILVSDPLLHKRLIAPSLKSLLSFIPDPWSSSEFRILPRSVARIELALPLDGCIFLVFGQISLRKGIQRILRAVGLQQCSCILVIAGQVLPDAKHLLRELQRNTRVGLKVIIRDGLIPEHEVAMYFSAADAVLSDYPRSFVVSSGAFTRTLAAGKIPLIPEHGANFELSQLSRIAVTYRSEDPTSLSDKMDLVCDSVAKGKALVCVAAQAREASRREINAYIEYVERGYKAAMGSVARIV